MASLSQLDGSTSLIILGDTAASGHDDALLHRASLTRDILYASRASRLEHRVPKQFACIGAARVSHPHNHRPLSSLRASLVRSVASSSHLDESTSLKILGDTAASGNDDASLQIESLSGNILSAIKASKLDSRAPEAHARLRAAPSLTSSPPFTVFAHP